MYLSRCCVNYRRLCIHIRKSNEMLSIFNNNKTFALTSLTSRQKCSISRSTTVLNRKRSMLSNSMVVNINTRHSHIVKDTFCEVFKGIRLPLKLIRPHERLLLKWKIGHFDKMSFFDGVIGTFVYVTECIASGDDALQDHLTNRALEALTEYISDAQKEDYLYQVKEGDIIGVEAEVIGFEQAEEHGGVRDVSVLSILVSIVYVQDFRKEFEKGRPRKEDSWPAIFTKLKVLVFKLRDTHTITNFHIQRAYNKKLDHPLTDWMIADMEYLHLQRRSTGN